MDVDLICRTGILKSDKPDVGLVNLPHAAEGEDLFFHPRIQGVQGTEVQVLQVQSHGRCHSLLFLLLVVI
jgi:hypothetical protein